MDALAAPARLIRVIVMMGNVRVSLSREGSPLAWAVEHLAGQVYPYLTGVEMQLPEMLISPASRCTA